MPILNLKLSHHDEPMVVVEQTDNVSVVLSLPSYDAVPVDVPVVVEPVVEPVVVAPVEVPVAETLEKVLSKLTLRLNKKEEPEEVEVEEEPEPVEEEDEIESEINTVKLDDVIVAGEECLITIKPIKKMKITHIIACNLLFKSPVKGVRHEIIATPDAQSFQLFVSNEGDEDVEGLQICYDILF